MISERFKHIFFVITITIILLLLVILGFIKMFEDRGCSYAMGNMAQVTEVIIYTEQGEEIDKYQGECISVFYHVDGKVTINLEDNSKVTVTGGTVLTIEREVSE